MPQETFQIFHPISNQCLESNGERKEIYMNPCQDQNDAQKWIFSEKSVDLIKKDMKF